MDSKDILNKEFSTQEFTDRQPYGEMLGKYRKISHHYALMENNIAVLSDLRANVSYIYYGGFAQSLGIAHEEPDGQVSSIWEEEIFKHIHPDDLAGKHLQELCFYHFIKCQPKRKRAEYYLMSMLRMRNRANGYVPVLHRMFYIPAPDNDNLWLALCLYSPLLFDMPVKCLVVNSVNGEMTELEKQNNTKILSVREKQVLAFIDKGLTSKEIAEILFISKHTVSRHRQEILGKLQVKNSIEACRIAKQLKLI